MSVSALWAIGVGGAIVDVGLERRFRHMMVAGTYVAFWAGTFVASDRAGSRVVHNQSAADIHRHRRLKRTLF